MGHFLIDKFADVCGISCQVLLSSGLPLWDSSFILVFLTLNLCTHRFTVNFVITFCALYTAHILVWISPLETFSSIKNQIKPATHNSQEVCETCNTKTCEKWSVCRGLFTLLWSFHETDFSYASRFEPFHTRCGKITKSKRFSHKKIFNEKIVRTAKVV